MFNFFNLFLLLSIWWAALMVISGASDLSLFHLFSGVCLSFAIAFVIKRMKIIQDGDMQYLNLGFHRHFLTLFLSNLIPSIKLLFNMAIFHRNVAPVLIKVKYHGENRALLVASLNMVAGISSVSFKDEYLLIHVINHEYFNPKKLKNIRKSLGKINDDSLV